MSDTSTPPVQAKTEGRPVDLATEFLDRSTPLSRIRNLLHRYPALSPAIVLIIAVTVFGIISPRFFYVNNLSLITQQVAVVGTLAIAQTLVILTAGIDLSVGAVMVLSSMVVAQTASQNHVPAVLALLLGLVVGLAAGALNGILVTRLKLPPFIVTLGTLNIFLAITLLYSNSASVIGQNIPDLITSTGATFKVGEEFTLPCTAAVITKTIGVIAPGVYLLIRNQLFTCFAFLSPWVRVLVKQTISCIFPFSFCWQAVAHVKDTIFHFHN